MVTPESEAAWNFDSSPFKALRSQVKFTNSLSLFLPVFGEAVSSF